MAKKKRRVFTGKGGNFRQPTAAAAQKYLDGWKKQGVESETGIAIGKKDPNSGELKDVLAVKQARIRMREAAEIVKHFERRMEKYQASLATFKENLKQFRECQKAGVKPEDCVVKKDMLKRPAKPSPNSKASDKRRAGNFKPMTKKQAKSYIYRFFRQIRNGLDKFMPSADADGYWAGKFKAMASKANIGPRGSLANFIPRVHEALEVVGLQDFLKIAKSARKAALDEAQNLLEKYKARKAKQQDRLSAAETKAVAKAEKAKARISKEREKLDKQISNLEKYMKSSKGVAARKRLRRNPMRRAARRSRKMRKARKSR